MSGDLTKIQAALAVIPSDDRDTWLQIGMAINSELGEEGFHLWDSWSRSAGSYNENDARASWKSFTPGGGINISTLFHYAQQNGWSGKGYPVLTDTQKARYRANKEAERRQQDAEQAQVHAECLEKASRIWKQSKPAQEDQPYLERKGIKANGLRQYKDALVVPVRDSDGVLHGLQFIDQDGGKKFLTGTAKAGHYHSIGGKPKTVLYLAEGYATAATIYEATEQPVAVCFDAANLKPVAEVLRKKFLDIQIVICADNDTSTEGNPGLTKGTEAAQAVGGRLTMPIFSEGATGSDFNDLAAAVGIDEVKRQILAAQMPEADTSTTSTSWDDPLLFGEIQTPAISSSALPSWLGEYAAALTRSLQTPEGMAVMMLLSCTATCLQKKFVVSVNEGYLEPLNVWTVTPLEPGARKTAVVSATTAPLNIWEQEQAERLAPAIRKSIIERKIATERINKLTNQAAKEDDPIEREVITRDILEIEQNMPPEMFSPRLWTSDVTPERLQNLMVEQGEKMALLSDEAVIFSILTGLYSDGGKVNLDIFLQAHAGSAGRADRSSRNAHLDTPALTFGLAVQPSVLSDLGSAGLNRLRGRGALDRFLFCIPENTVGKRNVRNAYTMPEGVRLQYHAGITRLLNIEPVTDENGKEQPRRLTLAPDAYECWLAFSEYVETLLADNANPIRGWLSKLPGAALRIAGNLHVVEYELGTFVINRQTMERALDLVELLSDHAKAAFDLMATELVVTDARAILDWITVGGLEAFTQNEVRRALKGRWTTAERLNRALDELQKRDIIGNAFRQQTPGRHATTYPVNPAIHRRAAA